MVLKSAAFVLLLLAGALAAALGLGAQRWNAGTRDLLARMEAQRAPAAPRVFDPRELDGLPPPVAGYLRAALHPGRPMIEAVSVDHTGTFNLSEAGEQWKPFSSTQRVVTRRPGFVWDGRVSMFAGLRVHVHDAYVAGEGILHPAIAGLVTLMNLRGTPEVARGELMRFLAEAAWYPTALLPSQGVIWEALDERSAMATLPDGDTRVTLRFTFGADGLIESVRADARGRTVGDQVIQTPWEGRWSDYAERDGMKVPMQGEVAWLTPEGRKPYWRGRIERLSYEFWRADSP